MGFMGYPTGFVVLYLCRKFYSRNCSYVWNLQKGYTPFSTFEKVHDVNSEVFDRNWEFFIVIM